MYIELDQGRLTNAAEAVDLPSLDDKYVTRAGFEFLSIDGPETAAFPHELDFIVRMTMGSRTTPREGAEQEYGDIHVAVIGPDEAMRATLKRQLLLTNAVHPVMLHLEVQPPVSPTLRSVLQDETPGRQLHRAITALWAGCIRTRKNAFRSRS